jgi:hypothetical protein
VGGWPFFKKRYVFQFVGLPQSVYEFPETIEPYLKDILQIKQKLGM